MNKYNTSNEKIRHRHRRLKKSIRETLFVITVGVIGSLLIVGIWIGSVIQTSERLSTPITEVQ